MSYKIAKTLYKLNFCVVHTYYEEMNENVAALFQAFKFKIKISCSASYQVSCVSVLGTQGS